MLQNEKISVVVPIYNVEEYLPRCLDSIIAQTYSNIEVMLVDDGSPDGAGAICDQYATNDERIRVFHIPNGGVAKARQLGVENSTGEYIVFVDPDDWLPLDSIETLYNSMSDDVDIVIGSAMSFKNNKCKTQSVTPALLDQEEYLSLMIAWETEIAPWAKLFRRSLFSSESFPNVKHTQDLLMNIEVGSRVRRVRYISDVVYYYLYRTSSTARTFKGTFEYEKMFCLLTKQILEKNDILQKYYNSFCISVVKSMFRTIAAKSQFDSNDPLVKEAYIGLKGVSLSLSNRVKCECLSSSFLRFFIPLVRNLKRRLLN